MSLERNDYTYLKTGLTIFFSGLSLIFFYLAKDVIGVFLLSAIIAMAISPIVKEAESRKIPGFIALTISYLLFGTIFTILFIDLAPVVVTKILTLIQDLPAAIQGFIDGISYFAESKQIKFIPREQISDFIADSSRFLAGRLVDLTKNTFSFLGTFLFIFVISFFLVLDAKSIKEGFIKFFPDQYDFYLEEKTSLFSEAVRKAFFGKVIVSGILGITIFIGLWILQVDRFIALAILAFLLDFIPFIGSTIATIIGVVFGLQHSLFTGIAVLILYLGSNFIEMNITTPIFMGKEASLHPVLILLAIGIGASVWGLLGVVISIPLAAAVVAISRTKD